MVQSKAAIAEAQLQSSRAYLMQTLNNMWDIALRGDSFTCNSAPPCGLRRSMPFISPRRSSTAYHLAGGTAIFENEPSSGGCATSTR